MRPRVPCLAVLLVATVLAGCGSDAPSTTGPVPATASVRGFRFTVVPPAGWTDVMGQFTGQGVIYDLAYADTTATGYKPSLTVSRERSQGLKGRTIDQIDAAIRERSAAAPDTTVGVSTPATVGGVAARQSLVRGEQGGRRLVRRQVIALHDGTLYTVALASAADDPEAAGILRAFLASWRWNG